MVCVHILFNAVNVYKNNKNYCIDTKKRHNQDKIIKRGRITQHNITIMLLVLVCGGLPKDLRYATYEPSIEWIKEREKVPKKETDKRMIKASPS